MEPEVNPYQSPTSAEMHEEGSQPQQRPEFRPAKVLATCVCIGLGANVAAALVAFYVHIQLHSQPSPTETDLDIFMRKIRWMAWADFVDVAMQVLRPLTGVVFIAWTFRVHRNLLSLGHRSLDWKPIGGLVVWFIPLANLVLPCFVLREIWWRSNPDAEKAGSDDPLLSLVNAWWLIYLAAPTSLYIQLFFSGFLEELPDDVWFRWRSVVLLSVVISGLMACWVVLSVSRRQVERFQRLQVEQVPMPTEADESN